MNQDRIKKALDDLVYLPSLKEQAIEKPQILEVQQELVSRVDKRHGGEACRPWDRQDLNARLRSYKASTWFCKPQKADALNCARNGWINSSIDALSCDACGASLTFHLSPGLSTAELQKAAESFSARLQSAHRPGCPWISNACDENLASYPPLPQAQALSGYNARLADLERLSHLPAISEGAVQKMLATHRHQVASVLLTAEGSASLNRTDDESSLRRQEDIALSAVFKEGVSGKASLVFQQRARLLACSGWHVHLMPAPKSAELRQWDARRREIANAHRAILFCPTCGAKSGLWTFLPLPHAGEDPGVSPSGLLKDTSNGSVTMIASLSESIAGGVASKQPQSGIFGRGPLKFGRPDAFPVFRSLSRSVSVESQQRQSSQPPLNRQPISAPASLPITQEASEPLPAKVLELPEGNPRKALPASGSFEKAGGAAVKQLPSKLELLVDSMAPDPRSGTSEEAAVSPGTSTISSQAIQASMPNPSPRGQTEDRPTEQRLLSGWGKAASGQDGGRKIFGAGASPPSFGAQSRPSSATKLPPKAVAFGKGAISAFGFDSIAGTSRRHASPNSGAAEASNPATSRTAEPFGISGSSVPVFGRDAARRRAPSASPPAKENPAPGQGQRRSGEETVNGLCKGENGQEGVAPEPKKRIRQQNECQPQGEAPDSKRLKEAGGKVGTKPASGPSEQVQIVGTPAEATTIKRKKLFVSSANSLASFDLLKQHRPFCPWVLCKDGDDLWRSGWKWTLEMLSPDEQISITEAPRKAGQKSYDSATRLRQALEKVQIRRQ